MTTPSKQELVHTQMLVERLNGEMPTKVVGHMPRSGIREVDFDWAKIEKERKEAATYIATLLSQVRQKDEALRAAEKVLTAERAVIFDSFKNARTGKIEQEDQHEIAPFDDALSLIEVALSPTPQPDAERCPICSWPYAESRENGCVPGDCSYRPREGTAEYERVKRNRERVTQPDAVQADATAWLIEFSEKVSRTPAYYGHTGEGLGETTDSLKAVRFARREDAQAIIDDIGWNEARPVEHMWADSKCCNDLSPEECAQVPDRHCDGLQPASPLPADDVVERAKTSAMEAMCLPYCVNHGTDRQGMCDHCRERSDALAAANLLRQSAPVEKVHSFRQQICRRIGDGGEASTSWALSDKDPVIMNTIDGPERLGDGWFIVRECELVSTGAREASPPADVAGMREAFESAAKLSVELTVNAVDHDGGIEDWERHNCVEKVRDLFLDALAIPESKTDAAVKALVEDMK